MKILRRTLEETPFETFVRLRVNELMEFAEADQENHFGLFRNVTDILKSICVLSPCHRNWGTIYRSDAARIMNEHRGDLSTILGETCMDPSQFFKDDWCACDPLAMGDINMGLIVDFGIEVACLTLGLRVDPDFGEDFFAPHFEKIRKDHKKRI